MADLAIAAGEVALVSGKSLSAVAGEAMTAGMPIRRDSTSQKMLKSDASAAATADCDGISLSTAGLDEIVIYADPASGPVINLGSTGAPTKGTSYGVSVNSGKIAPLSDLVATNVVTQLGVGDSGNQLKHKVHNSGVAI